MNIPTPENTREYYLALLDRILKNPPTGVQLGSVRVCESHESDPPVKVHESCRLKIMLKGSQAHGVSRANQRQDFVLRPGQAVFWAPHAWTLPRYDRPCTFLGLVFRPNFLRALIGESDGNGQPPPSTPNYYHTLAPIAGPAVHIIAALSERSREEPDATVDDGLFTALLRLCRDHLATDTQAPATTQSLRSWQRAMEFLHQNYGEPITRNSAAEALDLHPNYLSALCQNVGKKSFHETLESIRLDRARNLLRNSDLKLDRIAHVCGYSTMNYFIKVFRRKFGSPPGRFRAG